MPPSPATPWNAAIDAAMRQHRLILRRRAAGFGGLAAAWALLAAVSGNGWAFLLPLPGLAVAGAVILAQARAKPGRDFQDSARLAVRSALEAEAGPVAHAVRPAAVDLCPYASPGLLPAGETVRVEDRLVVDGIELLGVRRPDGRGLLLGRRLDGAAPAPRAWPLPRPLFVLPGWAGAARALDEDRAALRRAWSALRAG